ncbi:MULTISPECIES: alpha/beta hydrolase family protein [Clostridium]|jgi:cephalosporin-C deacetylase-like acetyl esterase|uniref:Alpha/beta hydrolase family protein n=1 Tax=Clostridium lapidicellarium TaxID=3240931 RepID=A0ABV4DYG1_9CLOT
MMKNLLFKNSQFEFETLRLFSAATSGMADIGEIITTSERIVDGDYNSWYQEWMKTAQRLHGIAHDYAVKGHFVSARKTYLRTYNYYRSAEFFLHENRNDPRALKLTDLGLSCFNQVMKYNQPIIEKVKIPYEGTTLPGHYYKCEETSEPRPVLILMTGYDGTKEEFYGLAMAALEHGMNCLAFEGPGQGEALRHQHLYFRYDYEKVVTPVVNFVLTLDGINPHKIVLWGQSLGGYLAPRAAAFEHRLAICVANGGIYNFLNALPNWKKFLDLALNNPNQCDQLQEEVEKTNPMFKWGIQNGMFVFGVDTLSKLVLKMKDFNMESTASKIQCPTLVVDGEEEHMFMGQAKQLYKALTCPKRFMLFTSEEGAGLHGQCGAKLLGNERILSWIDECLKKTINP